EMLEAILWGHKHIVTIIEMIEELRAKAGLEAKKLPEAAASSPLFAEIHQRFGAEFRERKQTSGKAERADSIKELRERIFAEYLPESGDSKFTPEEVSAAFSALEERVVRDLILEGKRIDGRNPKQLREITCDVAVLPRDHG